ncbi:MAG: rRNA pseudouridine synthase [Defluviitaleaceae bacterium]|nr:rRNA pseudouridine synthase [Defluviitaleaceae bacterium]
MQVRMQKFLAGAGVASRRGAEKMIADGRVMLNGETVLEAGVRVDPRRDRVTVDGGEVETQAGYVYIMLHKPEGVVTSASDPQGRPCAVDFVKGEPRRVFPVGRLDYDSSGLLLLTNDGDFAYMLTHPKHEVEKKYSVRISGVPDSDALGALENGVKIDGAKTARAKVKILGRHGTYCDAQITIREGKNRQIRKMCEAVGHRVIRLKRIGVGNLYLGALQKGAYRYLTQAEVGGLTAAAKKII